MMKRYKHTGVLMIFGVLFVIVISHIPVLYTMFYHDITGSPTSKKGNIILSGGASNQRIVLDGEWEFYWNRLLVL